MNQIKNTGLYPDTFCTIFKLTDAIHDFTCGESRWAVKSLFEIPNLPGIYIESER